MRVRRGVHVARRAGGEQPAGVLVTASYSNPDKGAGPDSREGAQPTGGVRSEPRAHGEQRSRSEQCFASEQRSRSEVPAGERPGARAEQAAVGHGLGWNGYDPEEEASASASPSGGDPLVDNGLGSPLCGEKRAGRTVDR